MRELRYTLVADGPSDDALVPILTWLLQESGVGCAIASEWADFRHLPRRPISLQERIRWSLDLFPCDLLFIHRDAENQSPGSRREEIATALAGLNPKEPCPPVVHVIPIRMTEAWLLFDEQVLRRVAGNPKGRMALSLPRTADLEQRSDPKDDLYRILRTASGLNGRRLRKFSTAGSARRVAELLDSFAPLRSLSAFQALESDLAHVIQEQGWDRLIDDEQT